MTDETVRFLADNCKLLTELDLSWLPLLTDAAIQVVADKCRYLETLDISESMQLTDASVHALLRCTLALDTCAHLRLLSLWELDLKASTVQAAKAKVECVLGPFV